MYGVFVVLLLWLFFKNSLLRENPKPPQRPSKGSKGLHYDELSRPVFDMICENFSNKIHIFHDESFIRHFLRKSVEHLDDLKWESFSDDLDYIAYSMNVDQNFSNCEKQCLNMNATLLAIPKDAKSMFDFQKAVQRLSKSMRSIRIFMHFEEKDMPNIVHEVYI